VDAHPDWALGFQDETWWSRFAQPRLHAWSEEGEPWLVMGKIFFAREGAVGSTQC